MDNESVVQHIQYMYNGDGQRIYEILSDGSLTGFLYDGNQVIAEFNEDGKVISQHIHGSGLGGDVGSLVYKEELNSANEVDTSYYFYNYRGDVIDVVSDTGTVSYRYDAFGNIIDQSGDEIENRLLFSSKRFNDAIGLSYFGARYYDSLLGRFISRDPMGYIDGPNQYIYVANNPLGYIDPFGFCKRGNSWENNYFVRSADQVIRGDYTDNVTLLGTAGQVALGFSGLDIAGDVRDLSENIINWEWTWGHAGKTALNAIGLLPVVGALKYVDEVADVAKPLMKNADEIADTAKGILKNSDKVSTVGKKVHKNSLDYVGETHVYGIKGFDGTNKIGESAVGFRIKDAKSIRAEQQARKLQRQTGKTYKTKILNAGNSFTGKREAREYETKLIQRFRRRFGEDSLPGNKGNR